MFGAFGMIYQLNVIQDIANVTLFVLYMYSPYPV